MNNDFSQRLLERIEQEQIKPTPRWVVFARRGLTWIVLFLAIVCAATLGSLLIMASLKVDLEFLRVSSLGPMLRLLLDYIPVVWVVLFLLFCVLEMVLIRRETHAYRYSAVMVGGLVLLGASLIGIGLYATSLPQRVEQTIQRRLPPPHWMMRRESHPRPEDGILFGRVISVSSTSFSLEGPERDLWEVQTGSMTAENPLIQIDRVILVEGRLITRGVFEVKEVHLYRGPRSGKRLPQDIERASPQLQRDIDGN